MSTLDPVALLRGAVAIPSPSGDEAAVANYLVSALASFCDDAYVDAAGNAIGSWGHGDVHVWLLGHIDTVPGHIDVRLESGVLHGRGAVDAKGSFCAFVAAVANLDPALARRLRVTLIGAVGEEAPRSVGALNAVATLERPDAVIVGEPSGWDALTLGYKGTMQVELTASEPSRHTSIDTPTVGERLVDAFATVRTLVADYNVDRATQFERLQLALLGFVTSDDGLAHSASMRLGLRLPTRVKATDLAAQVRAAVEGGTFAAATNPEADQEVSVVIVPGAVDAYHGDKTGVVPGALRTAIRAAGGTPRHKLKAGTADMNVVATAWRSAGLDVPPMVAYGPGDANLDHTPHERIVVAEYLKAVTVLESTLAAVAADGGPIVLEP